MIPWEYFTEFKVKKGKAEDALTFVYQGQKYEMQLSRVMGVSPGSAKILKIWKAMVFIAAADFRNRIRKRALKISKPFNYFYRSSDVQCGQRVASTDISLLQNGHIFVVGAAGASSLCPTERRRFIAFKRQNNMRAVIMKLMTAVIKLEPNKAISSKV